MRRSRLIVVAALATALVGFGVWLLIDRLFPIPASLAGEWVNETKIMAAGPGEVRLTIGRDGSAVASFDHERYVWWGANLFRCRVRGGEIVVTAEPDGQPFTMGLAIEADRFRLYEAADRQGEAMVFRRTTLK